MQRLAKFGRQTDGQTDASDRCHQSISQNYFAIQSIKNAKHMKIFGQKAAPITALPYQDQMDYTVYTLHV